MADAGIAEQIIDLLDQLHHGATTSESVPTYRKVARGDKPTLVAELRPHTTQAPGLLDQLGTIATAGSRTLQVDIVRTVRQTDNRLVREVVRTEARQVSGYVSAGTALPARSPGWDSDGARSPLVGSKGPDAPEPIAEARHVADLKELGEELYNRGWRPPHTLVAIALEDEDRPLDRRMAPIDRAARQDRRGLRRSDRETWGRLGI